jgi:UDP-N-acetylmuramyl pentapeptide phosphotransferase/UDP-N-acetylglucosamine-1-phosphate transferase
MEEANKRLVQGEANAHTVSVKRAARPTPEPTFRFWIISMMLVLVGLSTLKLR